MQSVSSPVPSRRPIPAQFALHSRLCH
jgi:hypothetical protein